MKKLKELRRLSKRLAKSRQKLYEIYRTGLHRLWLALAGLVLASRCYSVEPYTFICSGVTYLTEDEVNEAYRGVNVIVNGGWLRVFTAPADDPATRYLFSLYGISTNIIPRISNSSNIIPRNFIVAPLSKHGELVTYNVPSIGMAISGQEVGDAKPCIIRK